MKALLKKELKSLFYSSRAGWLAVTFSVVLATIVWGMGRWFFVGGDSTPVYPSFVGVMALLPPLFLLLIVAFCSISFLGDQRKYTLERLLVNPTRFYWSNFLQPLIFISIILLITLTYVFTDIYIQGEINLLQVGATYISLLLVCSVFISICLSISIFVDRVWWIVLFGLVVGGVAYFALSPFGIENDYSLKYNFEEILHGVLTSRFVILIVNYHLIAFVLVTIFLQLRQWRNYLLFVVILIAVNLGFYIMPNWKVDIFKQHNEQSPHTKESPQEPQDIAFIEGHGEVDQVYLLDAETTLARDYNIHRGELGNTAGVLDGFAAIIIAGPTEKFLEEEKYVLDQYIMQGGKVLWLLDGVYVSHADLKAQGWSASIRNDVNLDDMLYMYGLRVKSQLIVDQQCENIQLISKETGKFVSVANHYSPKVNVKLGDVSELSTGFISPIDTLNSMQTKKKILFSSSTHANIIVVPERIDFSQEHIPPFELSNIPMGVSVEGIFNSSYAENNIPKEVSLDNYSYAYISPKTKMVLIGSSSIITNELKGQGEDTEVLPMGYNRIEDKTPDNRAFLLNVMNWLTEDDELLTLKAKNITTAEERSKNIGLILFLIINLLIPLSSYYFLFFRGSRKNNQN